MKKKIRNWFLIFIPILILALTALYFSFEDDNGYFHRKKFIGKKFKLTNIVDLKDNKGNFAFETDYTVIDFWFKGCKPCLEEMKQFDTLMAGLDNNLTIASISTDDKRTWKPLFSDSSSIPFLKKNIRNWEHYVLTDTTIVYSDTIVSSAGKAKTKLISKTMSGFEFINYEIGINSFPTYLVLDKNGIVIESPYRLTDYIKSEFYNQYVMSPFLKNIILTDKFIVMIIALFLAYSIIYWLCILGFLLIKKLKNKRTVANND